MKIAVIGGTGATGSLILEQALSAGFEVKTLVRNPDKLKVSHKNLEIITGDALDANSVSIAIEGTGAVVSALGAESLGATTIYSESTKLIVEAMEKNAVGRVLCIGAVGMEPGRNAHVPFLGRFIINLILKKTLADMYRMQLQLLQSDLDWTVMWPPRLNDGKLTGEYRVAVDEALKKGSVISRADLAHFIVHNVENPEYFRRRVAIAY